MQTFWINIFSLSLLLSNVCLLFRLGYSFVVSSRYVFIFWLPHPWFGLLFQDTYIFASIIGHKEGFGLHFCCKFWRLYIYCTTGIIKELCKNIYENNFTTVSFLFLSSFFVESISINNDIFFLCFLNLCQRVSSEPCRFSFN